MGFPMTVERVVSRNWLDRDNSALMDDLRRLAEDSATLALDAERAARTPPDHIWRVEADDLRRDQVDAIRDALPEAIAAGKELVVVRGVTIRREEIPAAVPTTPDLDP